MPGRVLVALVWDGLVGYPDWLYRLLGHPVTWMGRFLSRADESLNSPSQGAWILFAKGGAAVVTLAVLGGGVAWLLQEGLDGVPQGWIGEILLAAALLSGRSLYLHVGAVGAGLRRGGLARGRKEVARIVGRDVSRLDQPGVCRAAIESLAESFCDAVVGPALAYLFFGLPGIAIYKAVSTADSMIGHRSARYLYFGRLAARADDILNLVPARVAALLIAAGAGAGLFPALRSAWRDAGKHLSPNAGWPEAAMAGALGLRLGGPRRYGPESVCGAWLGNGREEARPQDIEAALRVYLRAMLWGCACLAVGQLVLSGR